MLIGACLVALAGLLAAEGADHPVGRASTKLVASTAFVAQGLASGAEGALLAALILSWVGDLCLVFRDRATFVVGLLAFLLAHVAFAIAFAALGPSWPAAGLAAVPFVGAGLAVAAVLRQRAGRLAGPVAAYATAIGVMVATAAGVVAARPEAFVVLVGAVLFWVSDLCVARERFVSRGFVNRAIGLPLYYAAMLVLASAVPRFT